MWLLSTGLRAAFELRAPGPQATKPSSAWLLNLFLFLAAPVLISPASAQPISHLSPKTSEAFDAYVKKWEDKFVRAINTGARKSITLSPKKVGQIRGGEIEIFKGDSVPDVPDGIIHEWTGVVFVPDTTPQAVMDILADYDRHKEIYPEVIESRLLNRTGDQLKTYLRIRKEKFFTVVLDTQHDVEIRPGRNGRLHLLSRSTRIAELRDFGKPEQRELAVGDDSGFLWRLNAYWTIEPVDGGVMVECATLSLSRGIPWLLVPIIRPFVNGTPKEALEGTLLATRQAIGQGGVGKAGN